MSCTSGPGMSARRPAWVANAWKSTGMKSTGAKGAGTKNAGGRRLRLLRHDFKVAAELAHERYP
jgi:hypothetical protein